MKQPKPLTEPHDWSVLWNHSSTNTKTGDIPQGTIGATRDDTELSCQVAQCSLYKQGCYAWKGTPKLGSLSKQKAHASGKDRSLARAIRYSKRSAQYARLADIGDPCVLTRGQVLNIQKQFTDAGFKGLIGYTASWNDAGLHLHGLVMASCGPDLDKADWALQTGWSGATVILDQKTFDSAHNDTTLRRLLLTKQRNPLTLCPHDRQKLETTRPITCNECGLCDAASANHLIIAFRQKIKEPR